MGGLQAAHLFWLLSVSCRLSPSRKPRVHDDRDAEALCCIFDRYPRLVGAGFACRPQLPRRSAQRASVYESPDFWLRTAKAVLPNGHTDQGRRCDPAASLLLNARRFPLDGTQHGDGHDRSTDSARQIMIEPMTRVPNTETTLAVGKMPGLEWIATHVAERLAGQRPQINRFIRIQRRNVHLAVGGQSSPLPPPWSSGRDGVWMPIRPWWRHSALCRIWGRSHGDPIHSARIRLIPRLVPHQDSERIGTSYSASPPMSRRRRTRYVQRGAKHHQEAASYQPPASSKAHYRQPTTDNTRQSRVNRGGVGNRTPRAAMQPDTGVEDRGTHQASGHLRG